MENVRIDKYLWAVRIAKTRGAAADLCKRGKIRVNGSRCKPSRMVAIGDRITLRRDNLDGEYEVTAVLDKRVGAKAVAGYLADHTPPETVRQRALIRSIKTPRRKKGTGRPTKKERRVLEAFKNEQ